VQTVHLGLLIERLKRI